MVLKFTVTTRDMCKDKLDPATLARLNELSSVYHEQKDKISFANRTNTFEDPRYRSSAMQITDLSELPPKWTFLKVMSALRCYCPLRVGELVATYLDKQPGKNYLDLETGMWTLINTKTAVRRFDLKLFAPDLLPILRQHPTGKGPLITTDRGNPYTASAICTRIQRTFGTTQDFAREVFETEFVETIKDPKLLLYVRTTVMGHTGDTARLHYVDRSPREPEPEVIPPPPEFS
jgi:hypothetical protein